MIPLGLKIDQEYHVVEFNNVIVPTEVFEWLEENCGDSSGGRWIFKFPYLYFANPKDHLIFTLRWA
jgi:hypothetical protein